MSAVAVLGTGAGGRAVAADYARAGHEVRLFELPAFAGLIRPLRAIGGVRYGPFDGALALVELARVTTDAAEAVADADWVLPVVPAFGHEPLARAIAPHLHAGQVICCLGEGSGSLVFAQQLRGPGRPPVILGETNSLPYLARATGPDEVRVRPKTGGILAAACPAMDTAQILAVLQPIFPYVRAGESVLETILINFNAIDHVPPMVLNAGSIQGRVEGQFRLWGEGGSPGVIAAIAAVDREILAIRAALGFADRTPYKDFLHAQGFIDRTYDDTYTAIHASPLDQVGFPGGPDALNHRFLTEDVPFALVLIASIGDVVGVDTPVIDALITLAGVLTAADYRASGRTLARLGIQAQTLEELQRAVGQN